VTQLTDDERTFVDDALRLRGDVRRIFEPLKALAAVVQELNGARLRLELASARLRDTSRVSS
jgi:hypothetical protein